LALKVILIKQDRSARSVESSGAVLHAVIKYSNAVLDLRRIDKGELHEKVRITSIG